MENTFKTINVNILHIVLYCNMIYVLKIKNKSVLRLLSESVRLPNWNKKKKQEKERDL